MPTDALTDLSGTSQDASAALSAYLSSAGSSAQVTGDYVLDSEVAIPASVSQLELVAGSRLRIRGNHIGLSRSGTILFREALAAAPTAGDTAISAGGSSYTVGEYLVVSSYDGVPNAVDKFGYLRQVTDVAGSTVTVDGAIPRTMVDSPHTAGVALSPPLRIFGSGEITAVTPSQTRSALISIFAADSAVVEGIELHDSGGSGIAVIHSLEGRIDCHVHDLLDDGVTYFGYGVNVQGSTRRLKVFGNFERVRHSVTTNSAPSLPGIGAAGEPEECWFEPTATDCSDKSIDTHRLGWGNTIVPHVTGGNGGVQIRADNTTVLGGTIVGSHGPGVTVYDYVSVPPTIKDVSISYLQPSGIALLCNGPTSVVNVTIRDCYGDNIVLSNNCHVVGGSISAGASLGIRFNGSNNVVEGIQLGSSVTTPYIEAPGAQNNSFSTADPTDIQPLPAPLATTQPSITGTPTVGQALKAVVGAWNVAGVTFGYTWLRSGTPIAGATFSSYTLLGADANETISVRITARRAGYADGSATSAQTTPIEAGATLTATVAPVVSGTVAVGSYVTVSNGTWNPSAQTVSFEWLLDGVVIDDLTVNRVMIRSAWAGKSLRARVTASRSGWTAGSVLSAPIAVPGGALAATVAPAVSGTVAVGSWVTVSNGTWNPAAQTWKYEWLLDGAVIDGLTSNRVMVRSGWIGKSVRARVTAGRTGWTSGTALSAPIAIPGGTLVATVAPVVTGTVAVGEWVTASGGTWNPGAQTLKYEWTLDGALIAGLTSNRVLVRSAWIGKTVRARVTAGRSGWTSGTAFSAPMTIPGGTMVATVAPTLSGTVAVGSWVTASGGTWNPTAQTWKFEWLLDGVVIDDLTANRVMVRSAWVGKVLRARVTAGRTGWTSGTALTSPYPV